VPRLCYAQEGSNKTEEQNLAIRTYNEECKAKSIPESTVRPEIEEVFQGWASIRKSIESRQSLLNSRLYADDSGKGKLDTAILDTFTKMAGIGTVISVLVLILIYRIPETASERRDEHPKHK